jgi:hypothetical protein
MYEERRSALLLVPSMVARVERNILINPVHPDARRISHELRSRYGGMSGFMGKESPIIALQSY